jgi:hypothetical protein
MNAFEVLGLFVTGIIFGRIAQIILKDLFR